MTASFTTPALPDFGGTPSAARRLADAARRSTATKRALPSFLVLGAQRAGTSSLYTYLTRHPGVLRASRKEVHYFDLHFDRGLEWYRAHFPLEALVRWRTHRYGRQVVTGEASPYYLFCSEVPERVRAELPDGRFIVLLRNPIDRAISHYRHAVDGGREDLPLEAALDAEPERLADSASSRWAFSYMSRGLYAEQLERWFDVFPRERFLVLLSDDLFARPDAVISETLAFLGLPPASTAARYEINNSAEVDYHVEPAVRRWLAGQFREPNQRLAALLGRRLDWG